MAKNVQKPGRSGVKRGGEGGVGASIAGGRPWRLYWRIYGSFLHVRPWSVDVTF